VSTASSPLNVDPAEVAKFAAHADTWWDPEGPGRPLHEINDCRLGFVADRCNLAQSDVVDVGCGGGILTEALARRARHVTGIDATEALVDAARTHAAHSALSIHYETLTAEALAARQPASFDVVTCMELVEHVPDPERLIASLSALLKPGGSLFLSTINRNLRAYLEVVVGAEYLLGLLPRGTHDYRQFMRPAEVARLLRAAGLEVMAVTGMRYQPLRRRAVLVPSPEVNFLIHARRD
jgi:2-polyprenyl-6-hydroxyphenyl methylase/3-demethylubiquinone-9 3-methyltransferase